MCYDRTVFGARPLQRDVSCLSFLTQILSLSICLSWPSPMAFIGTSKISLEGDAYNYVVGNQIINNMNQPIDVRKEAHTIYDEFYNVKRGAIFMLRDIHYEEYPRQWDIGIRDWWEEGCLRVDRTICAAELRYDNSATFTAMKAWEKDFRQFSQVRNARNIQLFGINQSSVPMLIFYGELVPVAHIWEKVSTLGRSYIYTLARNLGCYEPQMWIDTKQGTLIRGLDGPFCGGGYALGIEMLPFGLEFLEDGVLWRYLSHLPLDREIDMRMLRMTEWLRTMDTLDNISPANRPIVRVLSMATNSTVAVGYGVWRAEESCLGSKTQMPNGITRCKLEEDSELECLDIGLYSSFSETLRAWLSQATNIHHKLSVSFDDVLFKLIVPDISAEAQVEGSEVKRRRRSRSSPIYFFNSPEPPSVSPPLEDPSTLPFYFWSFDPTGQTRIPNDECEYLGLPVRLQVKVGLHSQHSWPAEAYKDLFKWQRDRGFDPTTTDFTQYLGFPVFDVVHID
ncbi:hypothetical protein L218DRAFT_1080048 [Marasmius fiardii PR-910]|nr:hypothetical protein L218DRAFT_1080048 [Marasmius fiardii PR-910]